MVNRMGTTAPPILRLLATLRGAPRALAPLLDAQG